MHDSAHRQGTLSEILLLMRMKTIQFHTLKKLHSLIFPQKRHFLKCGRQCLVKSFNSFLFRGFMQHYSLQDKKKTLRENAEMFRKPSVIFYLIYQATMQNICRLHFLYFSLFYIIKLSFRNTSSYFKTMEHFIALTNNQKIDKIMNR